MKLQRRLWVREALILGLILGSALLAVWLASADQALAREAPAGLGAATPEPPQPLNPPLQTPAPPDGAEAPAAAASAPDLHVLPFQPSFRIQRGQIPPDVLERSAAKPEAPAAAPTPAVGLPPAADMAALVSALDWTLVFYDDFDTFLFPTTYYTAWVVAAGPLDAQWKDVPTNTAPSGSYAAWPAAGGADGVLPSQGYPNNVNSWMIQGPLNFTNKTDVYVSFNLWYETEPSFDWLYLCVSIDDISYDCNNYWSGSSGGWTSQYFWLTSYAGYPTVYIAWAFVSDSSIGGDFGYAGPYVDDIYIWDYTPATPPPPDPNGQLIANPSFETGNLTGWKAASADGPAGAALAPRRSEAAPDERPAMESQAVLPLDVSAQAVSVTNVTFVEGAYSALMARANNGSDFLFQPIFISNTATALTLNYWYGLATNETVARSDFFCASLRPNAGDNVSGTILVDLGCVDALTYTGYWQEVLFDLTPAQLAVVKGQTVALVFELYNTTQTGQALAATHNYIDYVWAYVTDSGLNNALDPHEPNDSAAQATSLACNAALSDPVIGDAVGGGDVDWYTLSAWSGQLTLDVNARTRLPASALDSVLTLYDSNFNVVAYNDDDGVTYDSFITTTVAVTGTTYYATVASYSGAGGPEYTYELEALCGQNQAAPAPSNVAPPPADTWTVMLYLNAEDPSFETILQGYLTDLRSTVAGKQTYLTVTVLYDGPGATGATRYVIQPTGTAYTDGVNRWAVAEPNMGDPATLAEFVSWSMDLYPAENYYLAIDDHGDGVYGMSVDGSSNNDQLTPREIYSALKDATRNGERKLDLFDYEACLMGLAENAYDLREWVDYVLFSQQISWGISTYPVYFSDLAAADTPRAVGEKIVARYSAGAVAAQYPHTISLIDTSRMEALRTATDNFANALLAQSPGNATGLAQARGATQAFAASLQQATNPDFAEYLDLYDLAAQAASRGLVSPALAAAVQAEVTQAVVAERHVSGGLRVGNTTFNWNHSRAHGLSIYYPVDRGSAAFAGYALGSPRLYQMGADGTWDEFLAAALPDLVTGGNDRGGMGSARAQDRQVGGVTFINVSVYLPIARR